MSVITACLRRRCFCQPIFAASIALAAARHTGNARLSERIPALKRIRAVFSKSKIQRIPAVVDEKSNEPKPTPMWTRERPSPKQDNERPAHSSDLHKLAMDDGDFAAKRQGPVKQKEHDFDYVFGISPCLMALKSGRRKLHLLYVQEGASSQRTSVLEVCEEAHSCRVPIHHVNKKEIEKIVQGHVHQGVCLKASPLPYFTEEEEDQPLHSENQNIAPVWLVIENVQDPMNLGAILRSAYFLGVDRVISSISQSCPLSPVVSKASSGTMELMEVHGCKNLRGMVHQKRVQGWDVVGTVGSESGEAHVTLCSDFTVTKPTLLLIGGEGQGLSQKLQSQCKTLLTIPAGRELVTGIESLNVSVATGILLHSLLFSRGSNKPK